MSYFKEYTESLGSNFSSIKSITNFTNNTDVIGLYAEKLVIEFLKKLVFPLNISTGSIISEEDYNNGNKQLSQIDIILASNRYHRRRLSRISVSATVASTGKVAAMACANASTSPTLKTPLIRTSATPGSTTTRRRSA